MKTFLLCAGLVLAGTGAARAQSNVGAALFFPGALNARYAGPPQTAATFASRRSYRSQWYVCKRTPAGQLHGKYGKRVVALERFLSARQFALLTDSAGVLVTPAQETEYGGLFTALTTTCPAWNVEAYAQEMAFYRAEESRRQATRP